MNTIILRLLFVIAISIVFQACQDLVPEDEIKGQNNRIELAQLSVSEIGFQVAKVQSSISLKRQSVDQHGFCWSLDANPDLSDNFSELGKITEDAIISNTISDLIPDTTYYVKAYVNINGIILFGEVLSFQTLKPEVPSLSFPDITDITGHSANIQGNIINAGGDSVSVLGICWNTTGNPTIDDDTLQIFPEITMYDIQLSNLNIGTTYFAKTFAINNIGIGYSEEFSFTTDSLPLVVTDNVFGVGANSAEVRGIIKNDGGSPITNRGFCWSERRNPTILDAILEVGNGIGEFSGELGDLSEESNYFVRAFAINELGVSYGHAIGFRTAFRLQPKMILIPGGTYMMGSNMGEEDERPIHEVNIDSFYIAETEVTFEQYDYFCEQTGKVKPADRGWGRGKRPVIYVSWGEAKEYCTWLKQLTGENWRLPTEAEWEYAAGGGAIDRTIYAGTNNYFDLNSYANRSGDQDGYEFTAPVKFYLSNTLGLHDMSGNIWEWCQDWYNKNYYSVSPTDNPPGAPSGTFRVIRGGSYRSNTSNSLRNANRGNAWLNSQVEYIGFRPARSL